MIDAVQLKVLWSRRRKKEKKPNKRVSPNLSYQRHHLIRISSCHKTTSKKKTKKRILLKKIHPIKVQLQHAFNSFGKWCSFPQEFEAREKNNSGHKLSTTHTEERSIRNEKHRQLLCYSYYYFTKCQLFSTFLLSNINPVS